MNITLMCKNQAGLIGLLTCLAKGHEVTTAVSYSQITNKAIDYFNIERFISIHDEHFKTNLQYSDLLLSVHGDEIVPDTIIAMVPKAVNVHPYYYNYKGLNPIERAVKDHNSNADVTAHLMTSQVDNGPVIHSIKQTINFNPYTTVETIYNKLYPDYFRVISYMLDIISP